MPSVVSLASIVGASTQQLSCDLEGEAVILGIREGAYFSLDPVGTRIWELIRTPVCVQALVGLLMAEYDVEQTTCEQEVLLLLEDLLSNGLAEVQLENPG